MTHFQKWLVTILDGLDKEVDEKSRERILEGCGRACLPRSFIKKVKRIQSATSSEEEFLQELMKHWKHLKNEDGQLYVVYDKCYCPMMKSYSGRLSHSFCNCSRGWIKELFESALQRSIDVDLEKSIKRGDEICRFRVSI